MLQVLFPMDGRSTPASQPTFHHASMNRSASSFRVTGDHLWGTLCVAACHGRLLSTRSWCVVFGGFFGSLFRVILGLAGGMDLADGRSTRVGNPGRVHGPGAIPVLLFSGVFIAQVVHACPSMIFLVPVGEPELVKARPVPQMTGKVSLFANSVAAFLASKEPAGLVASSRGGYLAL